MSPQIELFGIVAKADNRTTTSEPCPRFRSSVAVVWPGQCQHFKELRCLRGHHLKWLPKPGGVR